jgi:hypothetical protein
VHLKLLLEEGSFLVVPDDNLMTSSAVRNFTFPDFTACCLLE